MLARKRVLTFGLASEPIYASNLEQESRLGLSRPSAMP